MNSLEGPELVRVDVSTGSVSFLENMFQELFRDTCFANTAMFHGHRLLRRFIDNIVSFLLSGLDWVTLHFVCWKHTGKEADSPRQL